MKIISVPLVNALGLGGSEKMGDAVLNELGVEFEKIDVDNSDIEVSGEKVYSRAKEIFGGGGKFVFVGGDHSMTYPIFRAFSEMNKDSFLIVFDAHADCMPAMKEPTHEEFLRGLIEGGFVKPENVILVGARKFEDVEKKFLIERGVKVFEEVNDVEAVADYITERANGKDVYVSVDVDVLDPAFAPAVNYPEPNGLSSRELFYLLKRIFCIKSLKVLDVVEVCVDKDEKYDFRTVKVAAKIVDEFLKS